MDWREAEVAEVATAASRAAALAPDRAATEVEKAEAAKVAVKVATRVVGAVHHRATTAVEMEEEEMVVVEQAVDAAPRRADMVAAPVAVGWMEVSEVGLVAMEALAELVEAAA